MPKKRIALLILLTIVAVANVVVLARLVGPLIVDIVPRAPEGITCQGCESPQVQRALADAAAAGRRQIQGTSGDIHLWALGLLAVNIIAPIVAWRLGRGMGPV